ncbi:MAG TPA: MFS transporter [Thermoanaerobaculia bacterium]|nr:MFS transporter [Thermoanaerobaculia bacterium]
MRRGPLATLFAIVFIDLMGFGIVIPLLPLYGERYHPSALAMGLLLSAFSATQFAAAPVLGRLSDRFGRKPVLLLSLAGSVAGYLLFAFARSLTGLLAARIIDGISGGNISTAQAYVADVTTPEKRAKGMGMIGAAFGLGFIFGPAIAGVTVRWGTWAPGVAAAAMSALAFAATAVFLREPERTRVSAAGKGLSALGRALGNPTIAALLAIFFLLTFAFSNFEATFAQFLHDSLGATPSRVAFLFVYVGVLVSVVQGGLVGPLTRALGERRLLVAGGFAVAAALAFLPLSLAIPLVMAALVPLTLGIGSTNPSLSSLVSKEARAEDRGTVLGAYQSVSALGRILGPLWGEIAYFRFGRFGPHWTGAAFAAAAAVFSLTLRKSR